MESTIHTPSELVTCWCMNHGHWKEEFFIFRWVHGWRIYLILFVSIGEMLLFETSAKRLLNFEWKETIAESIFSIFLTAHTVEGIRINMHNWCSHKIPDWLFNVPIICWGSDSSRVRLISLTRVSLPTLRLDEKLRVEQQNRGKSLINK